MSSLRSHEPRTRLLGNLIVYTCGARPTQPPHIANCACECMHARRSLVCYDVSSRLDMSHISASACSRATGARPANQRRAPPLRDGTRLGAGAQAGRGRATRGAATAARVHRGIHSGSGSRRLTRSYAETLSGDLFSYIRELNFILHCPLAFVLRLSRVLPLLLRFLLLRSRCRLLLVPLAHVPASRWC